MWAALGLLAGLGEIGYSICIPSVVSACILFLVPGIPWRAKAVGFTCTGELYAHPVAPKTEATRVGQPNSQIGKLTKPYFGCFPIRRYGFNVLMPSGNFFFTSSSGMAEGTTTSPPGCQLAGVETPALVVSCSESRRLHQGPRGWPDRVV